MRMNGNLQPTEVEVQLIRTLMAAHGLNPVEIAEATKGSTIWKETDPEFNMTYVYVKGITIPPTWMSRTTPSEMRFEQDGLKISLMLFPVPKIERTVETEIAACNGGVPCPQLRLPTEVKISIGQPFHGP